MRCKDANKQLDNYLSGKLDGQVKQELENHLLACTRCQSNLSVLKSIKQLAIEEQSLYTDNIYFAGKVVNRIEHRKVSSHFDIKSRLITYTAIAASILVGLFIGTQLGTLGTKVISNNSNAELLIAEEYFTIPTETIYSFNFEDIESENNK